MGIADESVVCFQCGNPVADESGPRLNKIDEDRNCPACVKRLLEDMQPIFHTPWKVDQPVEQEG